MALQPNVSSGLAKDWENPDYILFDTIVGPDVTDLLIKDLQYSTDYRFAIRTLSKKGKTYHSKWYGYGNGRQLGRSYLGITTGDRYNVPEVIVVNQVTKTTFRINIDRAYATSGDDGTFKTNFEVDENGNFVTQLDTMDKAATTSLDSWVYTVDGLDVTAWLDTTPVIIKVPILNEKREWQGDSRYYFKQGKLFAVQLSMARYQFDGKGAMILWQDETGVRVSCPVPPPGVPARSG